MDFQVFYVLPADRIEATVLGSMDCSGSAVVPEIDWIFIQINQTYFMFGNRLIILIFQLNDRVL